MGEPLARFGVCTDLHFARRPDEGTRHYAGAIGKLAAFIDRLHGEQVDTLLVLGDLVDHPKDPAAERALLADVRDTLNGFDGHWQALPGNHDIETIRKDEFAELLDRPLPPWVIDVAGVAVVGIDGTFTPDGKPYAPGSFEWHESMFAGDQVAWLRERLAAIDRPVVVVSHQQLAGRCDRHIAANADDVLAALAESGKVVACLAGHDHHGFTVEARGLACHTIRTMVERDTPHDHAGAIVTVAGDRGVSIDYGDH